MFVFRKALFVLLCITTPFVAAGFFAGAWVVDRFDCEVNESSYYERGFAAEPLDSEMPFSHTCMGDGIGTAVVEFVLDIPAYAVRSVNDIEMGLLSATFLALLALFADASEGLHLLVIGLLSILRGVFVGGIIFGGPLAVFFQMLEVVTRRANANLISKR